MNWQPIETAPKDGRTILLGRGPIEDCEAISVPGFWQEGWEDSIDDMGCDSGFVDVHFQEFSGGRSFGAEKYRCAPNQPTHWMPLPAAPGVEDLAETVTIPAKEWSAMEFWLDRCEAKGHLENCPDLVEPWEKLQAAILAMGSKESP